MSKYRQLEWTSENVATFWDFESGFPNRYFTHSAADGLINRLHKYFANSESILDYGCGTGFLLARLAAQGHQVAETDTSEQSLKATLDRLQRHDNFLGAFTPDTLLAEGRQFDTILAVELVEHLYDDWLDDVLGMLRKLLKPNGRIIITTSNQERFEDSLLMCPCCKSIFHRWQHVRTWSQASFTEYVEHRGFCVLNAFTTDFSKLETAQERWERLSWSKRLIKTMRGKAPKDSGPSNNPHLTVIFQPAA